MITSLNGYDFEEPSAIHECGPGGHCEIDDALSRARTYYISGYDVNWIWAYYRKPLRELIDMNIWRSRDAAVFYQQLERSIVNAQSSRIKQLFSRVLEFARR